MSSDQLLPESPDDLIPELIRRFATAEANLRAALPTEIDAFIDPVTARPILLGEAQLALQESETRYRQQVGKLDAIFLAMTDAVIVYNAAGVAVQANPAAVAIFGFNPVGEIVTEIYRRVLVSHPDPRPAIPDEWPTIRALRGNVVVGEPFIITNVQDGREISILVSASPLFEQDRVSGAVAIWHDITEREQAARALEALAQFNRTVLDSLEAHLAVLDKSGNIIAVNEAWEQFARDNGDLTLARTGIGINYLAVCQRSAKIGNEDAQRVLIGIQAVLNGSQSQFEFEYACHSPHKQRWFVMRVTTLVGATGGAVISHTNTTERYIAERDRHFLSEASVMLSASLNYKATFTRLAQLAVPALSDWCIVHVLDKDGIIQEVALAHRDTGKAAWASEVARNYPPAPNTKSLVWKVLQSGKSELYPEITDAMLVGRALNDQHLAFLREMGFASLMVVPLVAHGRTLGVIQFVLSEAVRHFDKSDLAMAEELAHRAAIAIDNSRLYQEAHEQRERLQITLSSIGDGMIASDAEGHIDFMNPVAESLTGWKQAEAKGCDLQQVFHIIDETNQKPIENPAITVMREEVASGVANHTVLVGRDGTKFHIDHNAAPIRDDTGAIVGIILVFRDVSKQRQAQIALRESEQRFKAIFDQAAVGMTQWTLDGRCVLVNQRFCKMMGYSQEELLNHTLDAFTHPDDLPTQRKQLQQINSGEHKSFSMEKRYIHKDGSTIWTNVTSSSVRSFADDHDSYVSIVEDITERKRADEQLRFQAHLLDTVGQAVIATNLQGKVIYWNRFAESLYGWSAEEAMGRNIGELTISSSTLEQATEIMGHLRNGESWTGEFVVQRRDGTPFPALVTDSPIYDPSGALIGIIGVSTDITERKRAEQALIQSESRFSKVFQLSPVAISITTLEDGRFVEINDSFVNLIGYTREDIIGRTSIELGIWPDTKSRTAIVDDLHSQPLQSKYGMEISFRTKSGDLRTVLVSREAFTLGRQEYILAILYDITDRKQADQALVNERNVLRTLIDNLPDYIFTKDLAGRFVVSNAAHAHAVQLEPSMLVGKTAAELFEQELAPVFENDDLVVMQTGQALINIERTTTNADGSRKEVLTTKVPLRDQTGRIIGLVGISHDVTERNRARKALQESEAAEREQRLLAEALLDSSTVLTSVLDPAVVMNRILENVSHVIACKSANIMLLDDNMAYIAHWRGYPADLDDFFKTERFPLEAPLLRQMLETHLPVVIDDVTDYPGWEARPEAVWIRSLASAPIQVLGQVIGFLNTMDSEPKRFSPLDTKGLQAFASQAAIAIENAQLYDELRRYALELENRVEQRTHELRVAKERVENILNNSSDAIVILDNNLSIQQSNPAFNMQFGYGIDEVYSQSMNVLVEPDQIHWLQATLAQVVQSHQSARIELVVCRKDRSTFSADIAIAAIQEHDLIEAGAICSIRDNTPQKHLEQELRTALEQEKELGQIKSRLVSMASHEFRTPLTTIQSSGSLIELYLRRSPNVTHLPALDKHFKKIEVAVKRMTDMLDDVLTIGKGDAGLLVFKPEPLDLELFCKDLVEEIQLTASPGHRVIFSPVGQCDNIVADKHLLQRILINLLTNAVKYSPASGEVLFDVTCEPGSVIFRVRDGGLGIPEKDQARLFEAFHRAGNVGNIAGTGLGLAIVKRAVDVYGGTISFESQVGVGTTFTVTVPTS
ncbi:MAG: PAS domain S-box protein [Chloroflexota bacterium]